MHFSMNNRKEIHENIIPVFCLPLSAKLCNYYINILSNCRQSDCECMCVIVCI